MGRSIRTHGMVMDLLKRDNVWVLLSNGARMSAQPRGWDDVVPIGRAALRGRARPLHLRDRLAAHAQPEGRRRTAGGSALIDLLYRYLPDAKGTASGTGR